MNDYAKYYTEKLYPLQNGVLNTVIRSGTPFFLTGGTALSRYYFAHRYSDDLDLFVNDDPHYAEHVTTLLNHWTDSKDDRPYRMDRNSLKRGEYYTQCILVDTSDPELEVRVDLINDVAKHFGDLEADPVLGRVDSWRNILSNKLTALFRSEPKDVVDIYTIALHKQFNWRSIIKEAKSKEAGVEPETMFDILNSFPIDQMHTVKWVNEPAEELFRDTLSLVADDILFGRENSVCVKQ